MAGRVVSAFAMGAFFGVANVVAARLVGVERRSAALGLLASGLTVFTVIGVPFGTLWTLAFLSSGSLDRSMPNTPIQGGTGAGERGSQGGASKHSNGVERAFAVTNHE